MALKSEIALATSATQKYAATLHCLTILGENNVNISQLRLSGQVEEPVSIHPVKMGLEKMEVLRPEINEALRTLDVRSRPGRVVIADVLPVVNLPKLVSEHERVMKKPGKGEGDALTVFTSFFAKCLDNMIEPKKDSQDKSGSELQLDRLSITYNLIAACAEVDQARSTIKGKVSVAYDELDFSLSRPLVKLLSKPKEVKEIAKKLPVFKELIWTKSVRACKFQTLVPMTAQIAAIKDDDGINMGVEYKRGKWTTLVDSRTDLYGTEAMVPIGVARNNSKMELALFIELATKNATPYLINEILKVCGKC